VLEVVTFVRWCGPVEPFPDDGRFDEPRAGGGPVTCGQRETCEPFEIAPSLCTAGSNWNVIS